MSIATELQNLNDNILDAYTAVQGKGGTVPTNKNMVNLPTAISSISGGSGVGIPREVDANGVFGYPAQNFSFSLPSEATDLGNYALRYAFSQSDSLTAVDLSSLTTVSKSNSLYFAFQSCRNLASVDLSSLVTISGYSPFNTAFSNCTSLTSVNLTSLTTISGSLALASAFSACTSLTSIDLSSLVTISSSGVMQNTFSNCTNLTSVNLSSLATVSGGKAFSNTFANCTSLTTLSFPSLTASSFGTQKSQFNNMLTGCSNVTVHFPAAIQSTIGSWTSVQNGFSGTNTTVLFDL